MRQGSVWLSADKDDKGLYCSIGDVNFTVTMDDFINDSFDGLSLELVEEYTDQLEDFVSQLRSSYLDN